MNYQLQIGVLSSEPCAVALIDSDEVSVSIPFDPANTDYQAYLAWLEEGNTPLPADEPGQGE